MKIFDHLATSVAQGWQKAEDNGQDGYEAFTALATQALQSFKYDWSLEKLESELQAWALNNKTLPNQISVHNSFGQPSITLFNNGKFVVDLYFWVDFDTSIHSHGFRGAFKVIHGESVQEIFAAKLKEKITDDLLIVDMSEVQVEKLAEGSVRTIAPGSDLTHRVIHLSTPTVSLCVKTINEPAIKQWTYLSTGLAVQKQNLPADLIKKVYLCQYLAGRESHTEFLNSLLNTLTVSEQIHLYEEIASRGLDLSEDVIELITGEILNRLEDEKWWPLYEEAYLNQESPAAIRERALERI